MLLNFWKLKDPLLISDTPLERKNNIGYFCEGGDEQARLYVWVFVSIDLSRGNAWVAQSATGLDKGDEVPRMPLCQDPRFCIASSV